jgi:hypothetical protein
MPVTAAAIQLELVELRELALVAQELVVTWQLKLRQLLVEQLVERLQEGLLLQRRAQEDHLRRRNEKSIMD